MSAGVLPSPHKKGQAYWEKGEEETEESNQREVRSNFGPFRIQTKIKKFDSAEIIAFSHNSRADMSYNNQIYKRTTQKVTAYIFLFIYDKAATHKNDKK